MTLDGDLDMGAEDKQAGSYTQYVRLIKIHRLPINQGPTHHARLVWHCVEAAVLPNMYFASVQFL